MKKFHNNLGVSLIETIVGFAIISIISITIISGFNIFSNLIIKSNQKRTDISNLISAANEFDINENIHVESYTDQINFTLGNQEISIPIQYKTYFLKSQSQKKLTTFRKY